MAHLVDVILCPQEVSGFEHQIGVNGSPCHRDSVSSVCEWFRAWKLSQWFTLSLRFCVLSSWVISSMKLVFMTYLAVILCPKLVSDFEHEIGVNGSPRHCDSVSSVCECFRAWKLSQWFTLSPRFCVLRKWVISSMKLVFMAHLAGILCPQSVSAVEHENWVNGSCCRRDSVSSVREWFRAWNWYSWLTLPWFCVLSSWVILNMKLASMAHLIAAIPCPQGMSDFGHEIGVNGSSRRCDSVFSECEWFRAWDWCQWLTSSPWFCVLYKWVISSKKLVSMADIVAMILCPQLLRDLQLENHQALSLGYAFIMI